jgi:signal transduction histidine kinase
MAAELVVVDRIRSDLLANVSHELRTPIAALQARLDNLVDGVEAPDIELLRSMLHQTERLGRLVTQFLDLSRLESRSVPLRLESVDLSARLDAVAAEARLQEPDRCIETLVRPEDLALVADADRIHQVLADLTTNALRNGPPGRPVRLSASTDHGDVVLTVSDEGPGIPDSKAPGCSSASTVPTIARPHARCRRRARPVPGTTGQPVADRGQPAGPDRGPAGLRRRRLRPAAPPRRDAGAGDRP